MDRVRSSAIRGDLSKAVRLGAGDFRAASCPGPGQAAQFTLPEYARQLTGLRKYRFSKEFFASRRGDCAGAASPQTEKLSPQPHSPLTFGLRKRKASFRPCLTKSTMVPFRRPRLEESTKTVTPRSSNTACPGCGPSA